MASSSSFVPDWKYDVFLNFRGEDTRKTFIGHLYKALVQNSINTFIDAEELRKGNGLSQLLTAISDSRLSVVVFSQNYASSTWCLKELVQILQCMDQKKQIVIPIFYQLFLNTNMILTRTWKKCSDGGPLYKEPPIYVAGIHKIAKDSSTFKNLTELEREQASRRRKIVEFSGIAIEELPSIIYSLTGLATLTLRYSKDFKSLTSNICQLKSLNYLSLSGCTKFEVFPDILENMERLASLDLDRTSIRELPASIERLQGLVSLNLKKCKSLVYIPDSICNLLSLEWLNLHGCSELSKLPEDLRYLKNLHIGGTGIRGYRPKQQFITLADLAQFRSTAPMINAIIAMVPNNEQNEAVADGESLLPWSDGSEILTDHEESSYGEEMRLRDLEFLEAESTLEGTSIHQDSNHGSKGSHPKRQSFSTSGNLDQNQSTAPLTVTVDSSCEEKEAVAVEAILSYLKQSSHEEEKEETEEKAVAASRRGGRIWGCICGSRAASKPLLDWIEVCEYERCVMHVKFVTVPSWVVSLIFIQWARLNQRGSWSDIFHFASHLFCFQSSFSDSSNSTN
ncbi:unnamed protein product [Malus baccata var. baccata]